MAHQLKSKEGMLSSLLDRIQGKLQATVPFASGREGHHRASHIQKHTCSVWKKTLVANRACSSRLKLNQYRGTMRLWQNVTFHMRVTWSMRVNHVKDKNQNSGSGCLFSYFSPYVTSKACRTPFLPCYALTSSCTAISITQHLPDRWWLLRQYLHYGSHCSL